MRRGESTWVYIMSIKSHRVIYIGVTSDLKRRIGEHKSHSIKGFTQRYNVDRLVYCEECPSIVDAIAREKQLKHWSRKKKDALIMRENPQWTDLAAG